MELAFVLLFVVLGTGAIVYAGLRAPAAKPDAAARDAGETTADAAEGDAAPRDGGGNAA